MKRRARTTLVWSAALFVALQIGLALAVEIRIPQLRDPFYAYKAAQLRQRFEASQPYTVVMLGTSRTTYALQGWRVEQVLRQKQAGSVAVFNFGIPAAGPLTNRLTLERLLTEGVRPDVVLIEVLPSLLAVGIDEGEPRPIPVTRLRLNEVPIVSRYGLSGRDLHREWLLSWPVPAYSRRQEILSELCPALLPPGLREDWFQSADSHGWVDPPRAPNTPEVRRFALELARSQYADGLAHFQLGGPGCRALEDLLDRCREEGIAAQLVLMPEGSDFRSWYPSPVWAEIVAYLKSLEGTHNAPLLDAREWIPDPLFADSHHVLPPGAALFSELLGEHLAQERSATNPLASSGSGLRSRCRMALAK